VEALNYVAGYTIANDLSARDLIARTNVPIESPFRYDWLQCRPVGARPAQDKRPYRAGWDRTHFDHGRV
jgi:hypothetical protein